MTAALAATEKPEEINQERRSAFTPRPCSIRPSESSVPATMSAGINSVCIAYNGMLALAQRVEHGQTLRQTIMLAPRGGYTPNRGLAEFRSTANQKNDNKHQQQAMANTFYLEGYDSASL